MRKEKSYQVLIFMVCLSGIALLSGSCSSVKTVAESSYTDSVTMVRHDTMTVERWRLQRDTVREREVHTIVKDTMGRVYYKHEVHHHYESHHHDDSSKYYKVLADSLGRRLSWLEKKETVKVKEKSVGWKRVIVFSLLSMMVGMLVVGCSSFSFRRTNKGGTGYF